MVSRQLSKFSKILCECCLSDSPTMHSAPSSLSERVIDVRAWNLQTFHLTIHFQRPWVGSNINSTEKNNHREKNTLELVYICGSKQVSNLFVVVNLKVQCFAHK